MFGFGFLIFLKSFLAGAVALAVTIIVLAPRHIAAGNQATLFILYMSIDAALACIDYHVGRNAYTTFDALISIVLYGAICANFWLNGATWKPMAGISAGKNSRQ